MTIEPYIYESGEEVGRAVNQLYDFLDCIGDHPLRALVIAGFLIATFGVWISLKLEDRKRSPEARKRRECSELRRMYRA
jgi:hypothetical protein